MAWRILIPQLEIELIRRQSPKKHFIDGTSLVVQWSSALPLQEAQVGSLVGELGSHMPPGTAKKKCLIK